jgi:hypothetical protein
MRTFLAELARPYFGYDLENYWTLPDVHAWTFIERWPVVPYVITFPVPPAVRLTPERREDFDIHLRQRTGIRYANDWRYLSQGFVLSLDPRDFTMDEVVVTPVTVQSDKLLRSIFRGVILDEYARGYPPVGTT